MVDCTLDDATEVLERMVTAGRPTCSIGVAALGEGEAHERLLARADRALYRAKRAGLGNVVADEGDALVR